MNNSKKWSLCLLILTLATLGLVGLGTMVIDPFFHYHKPLEALQYPIDDERYQNDGILKHFDYDAIITGTSMGQNTKTSEVDALFGVNSVKTCINGTSLKEISNQLQRALEANPGIKMVIRGLDGWALFGDQDNSETDAKLPTYLYDDNPINDVSYLLNKTIFLHDTLRVVKYTLDGNTTTTFDDYARWDHLFPFDAESVLSQYPRPMKFDFTTPLTPEEATGVEACVYEHAVKFAESYPDVQFYYFFTPYSILLMDQVNQFGILQRQMDAFLVATEALLQAENIHLFSFFEDYDTITNLNNYFDPAHYSPEVNSHILQSMAAGEHELTLENYEAYWKEISEFYSTYDYDALFS